MSDEAFETQADVVVIGGGIVGSATAFYLAKRNVKVVLLEKGSIGNEQSSRAWGFVRQQGRDLAEMPLIVEANKMWSELSSELETDIEWVQSGNLRIAKDEEQLGQYEEWIASVRDYDLDTRIVTGQEIKDFIPEMSGSWIGGMYTASDGHAEPTKVAAAFASAAISLGATVYEYCPAQAIDVVAGQVSGVVTAHGTIKTSTVLCAAGAWSTHIARTINVDLPQLAVLSTAAETEPLPAITQIAAWTPGVSFRQRPNGRFYVGGGASGDVDLSLDSFRYARQFMPNYLKNRRLFRMRPGKRLFNDIRNAVGSSSNGKPRPFAQVGDNEPRPMVDRADRLREGFMKLFPSLGEVKLQRVWGGYIDSTPDGIPVLGEVSHIEGFLLATGFSGHGFAMGPIVGRLMAELMVDGQTSVEIGQLSFERFRRGEIGKPKNVV